MKKYSIVLLTIFVLIPFSENSIAAFPSQASNFTFLSTGDEQRELSEYQDKPIVLDWVASWCGVCKQNQIIFGDLYDDFRNQSNFLSISYGGSGDDIDRVKTLQGSYPWVFGLDINNYASTVDAQNADVWILDTELNLIHTWNYAVVNKADFAAKLSEVIGEITSEITSEVVITSTETITSSATITSGGTTIISETVITSEMTITSETVFTSVTSFNPAIDDEVNTFGLFENPLFIGFTLISIMSLVAVQIAKRK